MNTENNYAESALTQSNDNDSYLETNPPINDNSSCEKVNFIFDVSIFFLIAWSRLGYSAFSQAAVSESISDPLKRYLYPYISENSVDTVNQALNIASQSLSYADASLSIATIFNVKEKREQLLRAMKESLDQLKHGGIKITPFTFNLLMFLCSFSIASLSPWTGLREKGFSESFSLPAGITMFIGQMAMFLYQYGNHMFLPPKDIIHFLHLPRQDKKNILNNIFCSKKGLALALRSTANMLTMSLKCYGTGLFIDKYLFGDTAFKIPFSIISAVSVYKVVLTQSQNDYQKTFKQNADEAAETDNHTQTKIEKPLLIFLGFLISMAFLLRTFSTPALYTGPIENPQDNYNTKNLVLACLGLLMGGFAASQYCKFMWKLGKGTVKNVSTSISSYGFFKRNDSTIVPINEIQNPIAASLEEVATNEPPDRSAHH